VLILPTAYVLLSSPAWAALAPCEMYFVAWLWVRLSGAFATSRFILPSWIVAFHSRTPSPNLSCLKSLSTVFFIQLPFRISIYARLLECQRVAVTSLASAVERCVPDFVPHAGFARCSMHLSTFNLFSGRRYLLPISFARLSRSVAWRVNQTFGMIVYIIFGSALFMLYWHWDFSAEAQREAGSPDPPLSVLAAGNSTLLLATELSRTVLDWIRLLPSPLTSLFAPFWSLLRVLLSFESELTALIGSAVFGVVPDPESPLMNSLQDPSVVASGTAEDSVMINSSVACPMRQSPLLLAVFCHVAFFITHMIYSQFYLRRLIAALFPFEAAPGTSVSIIHQHTTLEPYQPQSLISSTDARLQEPNAESVAQADMYVLDLLILWQVCVVI
jgi:hypothetical protein